MREINSLPVESHNNKFYFYAQHPCAKIIKDEYKKVFDLANKALRYKERYVDTSFETIQECYATFSYLFSMRYCVYRNGDTYLSYLRIPVLIIH